MSYTIITDSAANLTDEFIEQHDLDIISLMFRVDDQEFYSYQKGVKTNNKKYYDMLREGKVITTALISYKTCSDMFEKALSQGNDVFYIGFSSGLSGSYNVSCLVADELREKYPDRKIYAIDSLCASLGQGLLVYYALKKQQEGMEIDELYKWIEDFKFNICHWFSVDDLMFLKRGGRISSTTAIAGTILGIKPVLHVDNAGKLVNVSKVRGRKAALEAVVKEAEKTIIDPQDQVIFISHGDCIDDANYVADLVRKRLGIDDIMINYVDPVIGAHSGPGTIALFFVGKTR